jgi:hypothetical protein
VIVCIVLKAGNWWLVGRILDCAMGVEVGCLALSLVGLFGSLCWDTLFAKVLEGK